VLPIVDACPRTAPIAKSEVSHMISNGYAQSGAEIIGTDIRSFLSFSHDLKHSSLKSKGTSLFLYLVNSLINKGCKSLFS